MIFLMATSDDARRVRNLFVLSCWSFDVSESVDLEIDMERRNQLLNNKELIQLKTWKISGLLIDLIETF